MYSWEANDLNPEKTQSISVWRVQNFLEYINKLDDINDIKRIASRFLFFINNNILGEKSITK